ncbi:hypothetical protein GCM10018781_61230 [Kitasatospora indigofera]|uniref:Uncharacterized protein n=1 Tax=Kitasatospora indigofera TaxID=67307 RepID=A0A919L0N4_9ACTN|nr:hypothetical protein [Kitasatospora indigofera]GHH80515.1 hypothetical protein GCM10018781_61230 [Kitasatospora indigofera]
MNSNDDAAAGDLADALEDLIRRVAVPGTGSGVRVTIGDGPSERRTVRMPADVANWLTEVLREEIDTLPHDTDDDARGDRQRN